MNGRAIRAATALVVCAVAGFAAIVSYSHIYDLGAARGQAGTAARLLPLSVDGLILAASLVMLHEARAARSAPALARLMLGLGVLATVGANVAYGARYGVPGAVISAWPAVAFIGSAEMAIGLVRRARPEPVPGTGPAALPATPARFAPADVPAVAADARSAAGAALAASIAAGNPLSQRALAGRFGITRNAAARVAREVTIAGNGHVPG